MSSSLAFPADNSFLSMKQGHPDLWKPVASGWMVSSHDTKNEKGGRTGRGREGDELKAVFPIQCSLHFSFLFILGTFQLCLHGSQLVDKHTYELCLNVYMLNCVSMHACAGRSQRLMLDVFPNFRVRVSHYREACPSGWHGWPGTSRDPALPVLGSQTHALVFSWVLCKHLMLS